MTGLHHRWMPSVCASAVSACLALMPLAALAQTSPAATSLLNEAGEAVSAGRYVDALAAFAGAIAESPDDAAARAKRAQLFEQLGHPDLAAADYRVAAKLSPDDASLHKGVCLDLALANHDLDGALAACNAAVRLAPDSVDALSARGYLQLRRGAYAEAEKDYSAVLALSPAAPGEMFGFGVALIHQGRVKEGRGEIASATLDSSGVVSDWESRGFGMQGEILPGMPKTKASQPATSLTDLKTFLNKGEAYAKLAGGCGRIVDTGAAATDVSWSGECRFGLLHGVGKLTPAGADAAPVRFAYGRVIAAGEEGAAREKTLGLAYEAAEQALAP
ncbi:MAG: tetratricopeptide repeat protein [Hyphomonadaceae bacterium]|nr:tetratricopeptide repeat protein [Hyphomonadaceae bacterium]